MIQTAPLHQGMDEGFLRLAEIPRARWVAVIAEVNMFTPQPLQQTIIRPGVVGGCNTLGRFVVTIPLQPEEGGNGHPAVAPMGAQ